MVISVTQDHSLFYYAHWLQCTQSSTSTLSFYIAFSLIPFSILRIFHLWQYCCPASTRSPLCQVNRDIYVIAFHHCHNQVADGFRWHHKLLLMTQYPSESHKHVISPSVLTSYIVPPIDKLKTSPANFTPLQR